MSKAELGFSFIFLALFLAALSPALAQDGPKLIEYVFGQEFDKAKELVRGGVNVNFQDESSGSTALMLACGFNFADMAKFLVEHGADLNLQDKRGRTALMIAAGRSDEIFDFLLSKGADIKPEDRQGLNAFYHACVGVVSDSVSLAAVKALLDKGADVNHAPGHGDMEGFTCLMLAARSGHSELAGLLIKSGANVNHKAKNGQTALAVAQEEGNDEVVKLLKAAGAKRVS